MIKVTEDTFIRELKGSIKDLKKEMSVIDIYSNVKDIKKDDLAQTLLKDEAWREAQIEGFENVLREFKEFKSNTDEFQESHYLDELHISLQLSIIRNDINLKAAFTLDNDDTQLLKLREQGYKCSYEFAIHMLECMERN